MNKVQEFYENVIDFINYCVTQDFIKEDEEDYIVEEITKIKEKIEKGE